MDMVNEIERKKRRAEIARLWRLKNPESVKKSLIKFRESKRDWKEYTRIVGERSRRKRGIKPKIKRWYDKFCKCCEKQFKGERISRVYCSASCRSKDLYVNHNKGKHWKISPEKRANMNRGEGEESPHWIGDEVGYRGLHDWVRKNKGKPIECEFCGKKKTTPNSIHWANKSHKYKRDLDDWLALCVKCHKKYDKKPKGDVS